MKIGLPTIKLELCADEKDILKEALLNYAKSKSVTVENFDIVRNLYGKIDPAWSRREAPVPQLS